jgi:glutamine synthetase adenylyltransferase
MKQLTDLEIAIKLEQIEKEETMKDKEKQRELIIEIMKADEQSGIYDEPAKKQTAVDWLFEQLWDTPKDKFMWCYILTKSKKMEESNLNRHQLKGFIAGVLSALVGLLISKFI